MQTRAFLFFRAHAGIKKVLLEKGAQQERFAAPTNVSNYLDEAIVFPRDELVEVVVSLDDRAHGHS